MVGVGGLVPTSRPVMATEFREEVSEYASPHASNAEMAAPRSAQRDVEWHRTASHDSGASKPLQTAGIRGGPWKVI
jgi:hypothetical protein